MSNKTSWPLALMLSAAAVATTTVLTGAETLSNQRKAELTNLVRHDCGSCHGMTLKGGLGTPLLPEIMATYDADTLTDIILDGVPGTPMPPWRELLTVEETQWVVKQLQTGAHKRGNF
ncbi:MAG: cytochrome c [Hyphomicrobiales bacterium]|nr:cytochrome c [Hyphomicrobiales bacterium]